MTDGKCGNVGNSDQAPAQFSGMPTIKAIFFSILDKFNPLMN